MSFSSQAWLTKLVNNDQNSHHALVELCDALLKEHDPRGELLANQLEIVMGLIAVNIKDTGFVVATWQSLCLYAINLMRPGNNDLIDWIQKIPRPSDTLR